MCGMTTSWSNLVRLRIVEACQASFSGCLMAVTAIVIGAASTRCVLSGTVPNGRQTFWMTTALLVSLVSAIAEWLIRIS
ncbi:hypothetical protein [Stieleria sp. JC731]|uniref:hypothetical protein n=2 Tax=Pirellulaceae TaxID=2691357 RepID=UPI0039655B34